MKILAFIAALVTLASNAQNLAVQVGTCTTTQSFTVQNIGSGILNGSANIGSGFVITSGGSYGLSSNQSQNIWIRYCPVIATFTTNTLVLSDNGGGAVGLVDARSCIVQPALNFSATSGTIEILNDTNNNLTLLAGGMAYYMFNITNAGPYMIRSSCNTTSLSANSLYFDIDRIPGDPTNVWDMPVTSGFSNQLVLSRGVSGSFLTNQFTPAIYTLSTGVHQLVVIAREDGAQLASIGIVSPTNLSPRLTP